MADVDALQVSEEVGRMKMKVIEVRSYFEKVRGCDLRSTQATLRMAKLIP